MPGDTSVDRLYGDATALIELLSEQSEVSLQVAVSDNLRKSLLLAAASHFEARVCDALIQFVKDRAPGSALVANFVMNRAINFQYHSLFAWDGNNANRFFSLFGPQFKVAIADHISDSEELREAIRAFLEIGNDRNRLVHGDFATFSMDKTVDEIYAKYKLALPFVDQLPNLLQTYDHE